jgi:hypothetical protein
MQRDASENSKVNPKNPHENSRVLGGLGLRVGDHSENVNFIDLESFHYSH